MGPNNIPIIYQATNMVMTNIMNTIFKNINRLRELPKSWKEALVVPIYKKEDETLVSNYRPVSLLDIDLKVFKRCMYEPLYQFFANLLVKMQRELVKNRSVRKNMLSFLQSIHFAMNSNSQDDLAL